MQEKGVSLTRNIDIKHMAKTFLVQCSSRLRFNALCHISRVLLDADEVYSTESIVLEHLKEYHEGQEQVVDDPEAAVDVPPTLVGDRRLRS